MRRAAALVAAVLALAGPVMAAREEPTDWRVVVTATDRVRLRRWHVAWVAALTQARADRDGAAAIAADPKLFDPFAALDDPAPPPGDYRCRMVKIGGHGGTPPLAPGEWTACRIERAGPLLSLARTEGMQRPAGRIYPDAATRSIFLGTLAFGDERLHATYGHAAGRDGAGIVERIAPQRWRLVLPYPPFEATLDLLELVPA